MRIYLDKYLPKLFVGIIYLNFFVATNAQENVVQLPKSYIAYQTNETLIIDGKANEKSWQKSIWTDDFIDIEGDKIPKYNTHVKMLWDETYLYFYAELEEPHIWGDITERDAVIFYNNDFEIFIDPNSDSHNYYEFEMNVLNTVWDLFLTKPYRNKGLVINNWDINGLKSAVSVDGTVNEPGDIDKKWSVEIAMPWKVLTEASGSKKLPKDKAWRINFSRVNWDFDLKDGKYQRRKDPKTNKFLPEYNWVWSPQGVINMHEPEKWGYVFFSSKEVGNDVTYIIPQDDKIKWELYKLYGDRKKYYRTNKTLVSSVKSITSPEIIVDGRILKPTVENHSSGWTISIKSPFSNKVLSIREDGKFFLK